MNVSLVDARDRTKGHLGGITTLKWAGVVGHIQKATGIKGLDVTVRLASKGPIRGGVLQDQDTARRTLRIENIATVLVIDTRQGILLANAKEVELDL